MSNVTERSWFRLRFGIWVVCLATIASGGRAEAPPGLIPMPASVQTREGRFRWTTNTVVAAEGLAAGEGAKLIDALAPALGFRPLTVGSPPARDGIALSIDIGLRERLGEEGYELDVRSEGVVLRAPTSAGLFYGIQTMRQLLPAAVYGSAPARSEVWELPGVRIVDSPRFGWRGLLVDPARHFIPVRDLERYLDVMALHKFNRLQMHLTDDQGWRVQIRTYPDLVRLGSVMDFGALRRGAGAPVEGAGGFYTQDDIRRLVRYAAERYITLV
ncbi:MAG: family 20 glycosylhydrolase, partial [Verrucomicrobiales bacterium]|nr:family 20 glycosylhydrolase [Verrucomicrobiales bacterium]